MPTPSPGPSTKKGNEEFLSQEPAVASELDAYLLTSNIDSEEDP